DLDVETLELLEELLLDYSGTVLLVSHDRAFLNNVVGRCLVFEGEGRINEYIGGYDDWLRQRPATAAAASAQKRSPVLPAAPAPLPMSASKLNAKDKRELDTLPAKLEKLEAEQARLTAQFAAPDFYAGDKLKIADVQKRLGVVEQELAVVYVRWEELEALRNA
ncbi:MAG: ABC transporter ATP-binding protein, partial [Stenotrophobium sp.]